jgi:penicillin-binding protein 2
MLRWKKRRKREVEIQPDEILIDASNISDLDTDQMEGRLQRPLGRRVLLSTGAMVVLLYVLFLGRAWDLQFMRGAAYAKQAAENQLSEKVVFADRGVIIDRTGRELAYNVRNSVDDDFAVRAYAAFRGVAHAVGYVKSPAKDSYGIYFRDTFTGIDGAEQAYDGLLAGQNGLTLTETNAQGKLVSQSTERLPTAGAKVAVSLDAVVTQGLYDAIATRSEESKFQGGAGVIMDVRTGELLALTSFPEYPQQALTDGDKDTLAQLLSDKRLPFLDRAVNGLYAAGSIIKPLVATAALTEGVIDENTQILSTGSISIPNPYNPSLPSVFKDWRINGWVDMRHAIAVSSDVYFYEVGGGFENQPGLGITLLDKYLRLYGFGKESGLVGFTEPTGTIPTPLWKEENFPGDPWRIGDTYHTAIGQYGVQITPLQAVRAIAAVANGGTLLTPTLLASSTPRSIALPIPPQALLVAREGMRLGVTEGIAQAVNSAGVQVAAKTGTAQVGAHNEYVNSWMVGFFPYEHPRYAYAVVLERGPAGTLVGASAAMSGFLQWLVANAPQYTQDSP